MTKQRLCKHCGYIWNCKSKLMFVSCPSCLKKNRNINTPSGSKVGGVEIDKEEEVINNGKF